MVIAALIVGGVTAYWLGLRPGLWAAGITVALRLLAVFVPPLAIPIHLLLAAGIIVVSVVGARRERPTDVVRATRWVRGAAAQAVALLRARRPDRDDRDH